VHEELADRLLAAITSGDTDTVRGLYAPGALIWHNGPGPGGGEEQGVDDNLRTPRPRRHPARTPQLMTARTSRTHTQAPVKVIPGHAVFSARRSGWGWG
jgi:hypothetical protein